MRILNLLRCPICKRDYDFRNMKNGFCKNCQEKIYEGDDRILDIYFKLPLSEITAVSFTSENIRVDRK